MKRQKPDITGDAPSGEMRTAVLPSGNPMIPPRTPPVNLSRKRRVSRVAWLCSLLFLALLTLPGIPVFFMTPPPGMISLPLLTPEAESRNYQVYVFSRWGYHSAITLEQPPGWQLGPSGAEDAPFVEYAWGDLHYFRDKDHSAGVSLAAVFLPTESTLYIRGWQNPPSFDVNAKDIYTRAVSAAQLRALIVALEQTIPRTETGERLTPYRNYPNFYPSREYYLWWNDCNAWTVRTLHQADLAESPFGILFCQQVSGSLKGFRKLL